MLSYTKQVLALFLYWMHRDEAKRFPEHQTIPLRNCLGSSTGNKTALGAAALQSHCCLLMIAAADEPDREATTTTTTSNCSPTLLDNNRPYFCQNTSNAIIWFHNFLLRRPCSKSNINTTFRSYLISAVCLKVLSITDNDCRSQN